MKYKIPMSLTAFTEIEIEANTFERAVQEAEMITFADYDGGFNPTNFEVDYDLLVDPNTVFDVDELSALVDDKDRI